MFKPVKLLDTVDEEFGHTTYFFNDACKTLLPIKHTKSYKAHADTVLKVINLLGGKLLGIKILNLFSNENYASISIQKGDTVMDIHVDISCGIDIVKNTGTCVLVCPEILKKQAFPVTRKMIETALKRQKAPFN